MDSIIFHMVTARNFIFEIEYVGEFKIKRIFSDEEIESVGGVRLALEYFFDEVISSLQSAGVVVCEFPSARQRSHNDEYLFGAYYTTHMGFGEDEVVGDGCYAVAGDSSWEDINMYTVQLRDTSSMQEWCATPECIVYDQIIEPSGLIYVEFKYSDYSDEVFDIDNELISVDPIEVSTKLTLQRKSTAKRFRAARGDASIESIKKKIEEIFGLPEGSVALCDPNGKALRRDAKIATLRKRWTV